MTKRKSARNSDDADNAHAPDTNIVEPDKTQQQKQIHRNMWKLVIILLKLLGLLLFAFCAAFVLYIRLYYIVGTTIALLITCSMVLILIIVIVYARRQKFHNKAARKAKSKQAASLQEKEHTKKPGKRKTRLKPELFDRLVQEAVNSIPEEFQKHMDNLAILIEDEPSQETLERVGVGEGRLLLGLYQGTPLTRYGKRYTLLPERITIYQRSIEEYCHGDPARIREQVRKTVLHEIAHHFGMGHEEMPIWIQ